MLSWRQHRELSERSNAPSVLTPPRDDPATRPRLVRIPRENDGDDHKEVATRQACNMMLMVVLGFLLVIAVAVVLYAVVTAALGKQTFLDCAEQDVENGVINAGLNGTVAQIKCNKGYILEEPPGEHVRCSLVNQLCQLVKQKGRLPVRRCSSKYMFMASGYESVHGNQLHEVTVSHFLDEEGLEEKVAQVMATTYAETQGMCVLQQIHDHGGRGSGRPADMANATRQTGHPAKAEAERLYGQPRAPMDGLAARGAGRWSSLSSSAALAMLVVLSLVAVVGAGASKGATGGGRGGNEPDTAPLLDAEEAEGRPDWGEPGSAEAEGPRE